MIRQLFDFRGVLSGRQYAVVAAVQFLGSLVFALLLVAVLSLAAAALRLPLKVVVIPSAVLVAGVMLWTSTAVTAKRLRDTGLRPLIGVPVWFLVQIGASFAAKRFHLLPANTADFVICLSTYVVLCRLPSGRESRPPSSEDALEPRITPRRVAFGLRR